MAVRGEAATKTVLVCFGERKRPVNIAQDSSLKDVKLAIVNEYEDVLPRSTSSTNESIAEKLLLQVKAEEWEGVFVDVKEEDDIPDKSVLRIVEECRKVTSYQQCQLINNRGHCIIYTFRIQLLMYPRCAPVWFFSQTKKGTCWPSFLIRVLLLYHASDPWHLIQQQNQVTLSVRGRKSVLLGL